MSAHRVLLLARHAEAASLEGGSDHDRPLTPDGERTAAAMGRWLRDHTDRLDSVWCSSALRARQTWELAARALHGAPVASYQRDLYLAGADDLLDLVRDAPDDIQSLLVVGHNPTLQHALEELTDEPHGFPAGAVAVVGLTGEWAALASGRLIDFADPAEF